MTRILVVGQSGQLATALRHCAASQPDLSFDFIGRPAIDLTDTAGLRRIIINRAPDLIINAAAYTAVDQAEVETDIAYQINADAVIELGHIAAELDAPIIHVSTDYVFDGKASGLYSENASTGPIGTYGQSKLAGEIGLAAATPAHIIVRTSWVYAPYGQNFMRSMLKLGRDHNELSIVSDQIGSPTSADDLAAAIISIARKVLTSAAPEPFYGIVNVCGTGIASWYDFARHIFKCATEQGYRAPVLAAILTSDYPTPARRPENSRLDTTRLSRVFCLELPDWTSSVARDVRILMDAKDQK